MWWFAFGHPAAATEPSDAAGGQSRLPLPPACGRGHGLAKQSRPGGDGEVHRTKRCRQETWHNDQQEERIIMAEREPIILAPYVYRRSTYFYDDQGRRYLVELTPTGIELTVVGMDMCFNHAADWSEGDLLTCMPEEDRLLDAEEQDEVWSLMEAGILAGSAEDDPEDMDLDDADDLSMFDPYAEDEPDPELDDAFDLTMFDPDLPGDGWDWN